MHLLTLAPEGLWRLLLQLGGPGLAVWAVVDSSFVPTSGTLDAFTVILAAANRDWWFYYASMATIGSVIGGSITYGIGRKGGKEAFKKRLADDKREKVDRFFKKWGFGAVFFPTILPPPFPTVPFLLGAGVLNYPLKRFVSALVLGRVIRFFTLAYLAATLGPRILDFFRENFVGGLLLASLLVAAGVLIALVLRARRRGKEEN
jgi:membrane protein YqaA with SNARE-associated domain